MCSLAPVMNEGALSTGAGLGSVLRELRRGSQAERALYLLRGLSSIDLAPGGDGK